jgi:F0F1-type ATP synthase assembly protein I
VGCWYRGGGEVGQEKEKTKQKTKNIKKKKKTTKEKKQKQKKKKQECDTFPLLFSLLLLVSFLVPAMFSNLPQKISIRW